MPCILLSALVVPTQPFTLKIVRIKDAVHVEFVTEKISVFLDSKNGVATIAIGKMWLKAFGVWCMSLPYVVLVHLWCIFLCVIDPVSKFSSRIFVIDVQILCIGTV